MTWKNHLGKGSSKTTTAAAQQAFIRWQLPFLLLVLFLFTPWKARLVPAVHIIYEDAGGTGRLFRQKFNVPDLRDFPLTRIYRPIFMGWGEPGFGEFFPEASGDEEMTEDVYWIEGIDSGYIFSLFLVAALLYRFWPRAIIGILLIEVVRNGL